MLCEGHRNDIRQRNLALPTAFRWGENGLILDEAQLPSDKDHPTQEVDVLDRETEDLALTQLTTGAQHRYGPKLGRVALDDSLGRLNRPGHDAAPVHPRSLHR